VLRDEHLGLLYGVVDGDQDGSDLALFI